jgi:uncharacterized protein YdhG (YjbR/CyaY superfamily)
MTTGPSTIDEYLASQSEMARDRLQQVRAIVRAALPQAEERISYQIPAFRLNGKILLYFAGWANHISIYPVTRHLEAVMGAALQPYRSGKGTLRSSLSEPLPEKLVACIVDERASELHTARAATRMKN